MQLLQHLERGSRTGPEPPGGYPPCRCQNPLEDSEPALDNRWGRWTWDSRPRQVQPLHWWAGRRSCGRRSVWVSGDYPWLGRPRSPVVWASRSVADL